MWAREWRKKEVGVSIRVAMRDAGPSVEPFCQGKKRDHLTIGYIVVEENRRGKKERKRKRETFVASLLFSSIVPFIVLSNLDPRSDDVLIPIVYASES